MNCCQVCTNNNPEQLHCDSCINYNKFKLIDMDICHAIFPNKEIDDNQGCINTNCNGNHICIDVNGIKWTWKQDDECTCGCWDEWDNSDGLESPCFIYKEL